MKVLLDYGKKRGVLGQKGWGPNEKAEKDGFVPLNRACWGRSKSHAKTVELFLTEAGVRLSDKSIEQNPLEEAIQVGNADTVRVLVKHGARVEDIDPRLRSILNELVSDDEIQRIVDADSREL